MGCLPSVVRGAVTPRRPEGTGLEREQRALPWTWSGAPRSPTPSASRRPEEEAPSGQPLGTRAGRARSGVRGKRKRGPDPACCPPARPLLPPPAAPEASSFGPTCPLSLAAPAGSRPSDLCHLRPRAGTQVPAAVNGSIVTSLPRWTRKSKHLARVPQRESPGGAAVTSEPTISSSPRPGSGTRHPEAPPRRWLHTSSDWARPGEQEAPGPLPCPSRSPGLTT